MSRLLSSKIVPIALLLSLGFASAASCHGQMDRLTGTYERGRSGTLDVQTLPGGRIKFYLLALALLSSPGGPHVGDAAGIVPLKNNVAIYASPEGEGRLILRFTGRRVSVSQMGDTVALGFGSGVDAGGVFAKKSSRVPTFDPEDFR